MKFEISQAQDIGKQKDSSFQENQDSTRVKTRGPVTNRRFTEFLEDALNGVATRGYVIAAIADGHGNYGSEAGEEATKNVIQELDDYLLRNDFSEELAQHLTQSFTFLNKKLNERYNDGTGTTLDVLVLSETGQYVAGHVGDSRIYRARNELEQITEDQATYLVENLQYPQTIINQDQKSSPQSLGKNEKIEVETYSGNIEVGTTMLMITDGVYNTVSHEELTKLLEEEKPSQKIVEKTNNPEDVVKMIAKEKDMSKDEVYQGLAGSDNASAITIRGVRR